MVTSTGRVCANGALARATGAVMLTADHDGRVMVLWNAETAAGREHRIDARRALREVIGFGSVEDWNDGVGQTAENVAAAMELAAVLADEREARLLEQERAPVDGVPATV